MFNNIMFKRFMAYIIDLFIISILITLLSQVKILNPKRNQYQKAINEYSEYNKELQEKIKDMDKIDTDVLINKEYVKHIRNIDYYGASYTIIEIIVFIGYFTLLSFFNNGQTFGKEFMKIKVVNSDDSNVCFYKCLLRSLLIPIYTSMFLYTSIKSIILVVCVFMLKPWSYFYLNGCLTAFIALYSYIDVIMLIVNKRNLSLHDRLLKTKVIDYVRTK